MTKPDLSLYAAFITLMYDKPDGKLSIASFKVFDKDIARKALNELSDAGIIIKLDDDTFTLPITRREDYYRNTTPTTRGN